MLDARGAGARRRSRSGSKPTFELVVRNVSAVPCVRDLDKELQEILLLDADGARVWGSNDCFPGVQRRRRAPWRPASRSPSRSCGAV